MVVVAGVTFIVMRRVSTRHFSEFGMLAKKIIIKDSVLLIQTYARRQGPPSYVVRCVETNNIFTSQEAAAKAMKLSKQQFSAYFNGKRSNVGGYNFVRVAMAIPKSG